MDEAHSLLDKLIELGKIYGPLGGFLALFGILFLPALRAVVDAVLADRKNARYHLRQMTSLETKLADREQKRLRKRNKDNG